MSPPGPASNTCGAAADTEAPHWARSATDLLAMLRAGTVTATEVMASVLDRVRHVDPLVHAFVEVDEAGSMAAARVADEAYRNGRPGPLSGVPFSVKDLHPVRGMRTGYGCASRSVTPDVEDDVAVERLRAAGAIPIGKTRTPEQGSSYSARSSDGVASRTPWRLDHAAGGSSSGAAAAVAAGMGPLALGSDGAGSIRIPAALCGIVGLKPSFGRIPVFPSPDVFTSTRVHLGPLARTVEDAALFLEATQGFDARDPFSWSSAERFQPGSHGARSLPPRPRLAWLADPGGLPVEQEVAATTLRAAQRLAAALDGELRACEPDWGDPGAVQRVLWDSSQAMRYPASAPPSTPEPLRRMIRRGHALTVAELGAAGRGRTQLFHAVRELLEDVDILLTPTCPVAGWRHDETIGLAPDDDDPLRAGAAVYPFNLTGNPAISLPAGMTSAGLPVGIQLVAGRRADRALLEAAFTFEQAQPWADRWPALDRKG